MDQEFEIQEEIITLVTENGEEVDFIEIAGIEYGEGFYVILQPVELLEGMGEDEALVFEIVETEDGNKFEIVMDDETIDAVFEEYNRLLDEEEAEEE